MPASATSAPKASKFISTTAPAAAQPKSRPQRNAHLRAMAQGMPCLLQVPGVCTQDRATVVCCHSNLSIHGKALGRKADDQYSVWGCAACHQWLDRDGAPWARKKTVFMAAHKNQVAAWRYMAAGGAPKEYQQAAQWALDRLSSSPNVAFALAGSAQRAI